MDRLEEKLLVFISDKQPATWVGIIKHFIAEYSLKQLEGAADWAVERKYADPDPSWATGWELTDSGQEVAGVLKALGQQIGVS